MLLVYSRGPLYFFSFLTEAAWSTGRCISYNPPRNGRESLRKKKSTGRGTFSPLKGICMPSQNHCVCVYTILLILCGWYAYQRREEAAPADKVTGWSGQRSAVHSICFCISPIFKRRKLTVQEQQSILYGHSPERIDYIYTKAQNLILYFFSFLFFLWLTMRGRAVLEKKKDGTGDRIIASHSTNDIKG